jgi:hypothetical protein
MSHASTTARTVIGDPYDHDSHETLIASLRARGFGCPPHDAPSRGIHPAELYELLYCALQAAVVGETLLAYELLARAGFSKAGRCFQ